MSGYIVTFNVFLQNNYGQNIDRYVNKISFNTSIPLDIDMSTSGADYFMQQARNAARDYIESLRKGSSGKNIGINIPQDYYIAITGVVPL
ncbi:hypothetical protein [Xenorhabdus bovienii]|uniref:Uncharacterized protein n=1 Tax=Xenorhabdus bovienii str. Intermedium TaxID=1379677 RepID=A0A077QCW4_XENBV|nr:hypothetical protein [Xenorhabdus bovienii]CDH31224.1 hypothetical protein XBI1_1380005 [Xenorhabdus bovienii str. Intermedium]